MTLLSCVQRVLPPLRIPLSVLPVVRTFLMSGEVPMVLIVVRVVLVVLLSLLRVLLVVASSVLLMDRRWLRVVYRLCLLVAFLSLSGVPSAHRRVVMRSALRPLVQRATAGRTVRLKSRSSEVNVTFMKSAVKPLRPCRKMCRWKCEMKFTCPGRCRLCPALDPLLVLRCRNRRGAPFTPWRSFVSATRTSVVVGIMVYPMKTL